MDEVSTQPLPERFALLCFSHLRWNFVFQRPQHLLTRYAALAPVFFFEEPVFREGASPSLERVDDRSGVVVLTPVLPAGLPTEEIREAQRRLLDAFLAENENRHFVFWYYTPMALPFSRHLRPALLVFDCMDELSAFDGAPPELLELERELFDRADVVFAGGYSLYEAKRQQHGNVHAFPSSVDRAHFATAREKRGDPADQALIPHPRVGFFGVLDERFDRELVGGMAALHPEWHFVLVGPTAKVRPDELPAGANLHYLGPKTYAELPEYLANWDVAMLPFARNRSTRFISPTKTPEYLSAGKPVVSTAIHDVVHPYGELGLARIAHDVETFSAAIEESLDAPPAGWLERVDEFLALNSWDLTFAGMLRELDSCQHRARSSSTVQQEEGRLANV